MRTSKQKLPQYTALFLTLLVASVSAWPIARRTIGSYDAVAPLPVLRDISKEQGIEKVSDSELDEWIVRFHALQQQDRNSAIESVVSFVATHPEERETVIDKLKKIAVVDSERSPLKGFEGYFAWESAVKTLGRIRAVEAVHEIATCLNCALAAGMSPGGYAAAVAEMEIGAPAVPEMHLQAKNGRTSVKLLAVQVLFAVGGNDSHAALEDLLKTEKSHYIRSVVRDLLDRWKDSGWYKQSVQLTVTKSRTQ